MESLDTLGKRLKWARLTAHQRKKKHRKITLQDLADLESVSLGTIDKLEKERTQSSYKINWDRLARYLKVDREWLLYGEDNSLATTNNKTASVITTPQNKRLLESIGVISALSSQVLEWNKQGMPGDLLVGTLAESCEKFLKLKSQQKK